jgi:hypothetical protein
MSRFAPQKREISTSVKESRLNFCQPFAIIFKMNFRFWIIGLAILGIQFRVQAQPHEPVKSLADGILGRGSLQLSELTVYGGSGKNRKNLSFSLQIPIKGTVLTTPDSTALEGYLKSALLGVRNDQLADYPCLKKRAALILKARELTENNRAATIEGREELKQALDGAIEEAQGLLGMHYNLGLSAYTDYKISEP